jgi:hypothetical protein
MRLTISFRIAGTDRKRQHVLRRMWLWQIPAAAVYHHVFGAPLPEGGVVAWLGRSPDWLWIMPETHGSSSVQPSLVFLLLPTTYRRKEHQLKWPDHCHDMSGKDIIDY